MLSSPSNPTDEFERRVCADVDFSLTINYLGPIYIIILQWIFGEDHTVTTENCQSYLARALREYIDTDDKLAETYSRLRTRELPDILPVDHVTVFSHLVYLVNNSEGFRKHWLEINSILSDLRRRKWKRNEERRALAADLKYLMTQTDVMGKDLGLEANVDEIPAASDSDEPMGPTEIVIVSSPERSTDLSHHKAAAEKNVDDQSKKVANGSLKPRAPTSSHKEYDSNFKELKSKRKALEECDAAQKKETQEYERFENMKRSQDNCMLGVDQYDRVWWWLEVRRITDRVSRFKLNDGAEVRPNAVTEEMCGILIEETQHGYEWTEFQKDGSRTILTAPTPSAVVPTRNELEQYGRGYLKPRDSHCKVKVYRRTNWFYIRNFSDLKNVFVGMSSSSGKERQLKNELALKMSQFGISFSNRINKSKYESDLDHCFKAFGDWLRIRELATRDSEGKPHVSSLKYFQGFHKQFVDLANGFCHVKNKTLRLKDYPAFSNGTDVVTVRETFLRFLKDLNLKEKDLHRFIDIPEDNDNEDDVSLSDCCCFSQVVAWLEDVLWGLRKRDHTGKNKKKNANLLISPIRGANGSETIQINDDDERERNFVKKKRKDKKNEIVDDDEEEIAPLKKKHKSEMMGIEQDEEEEKKAAVKSKRKSKMEIVVESDDEKEDFLNAVVEQEEKYYEGEDGEDEYDEENRISPRKSASGRPRRSSISALSSSLRVDATSSRLKIVALTRTGRPARQAVVNHSYEISDSQEDYEKDEEDSDSDDVLSSSSSDDEKDAVGSPRSSTNHSKPTVTVVRGAKRGRGRPLKFVDRKDRPKPSSKPTRGRGRPRKAAVAREYSKSPVSQENSEETDASSFSRQKCSRESIESIKNSKSLESLSNSEDSDVPAQKLRGRPPKTLESVHSDSDVSSIDTKKVCFSLGYSENFLAFVNLPLFSCSEHAAVQRN